ncbi:cyclic nucleotide-binding domain-containing protein [Oryzomicrobium sp.]|uniref:Crp/Fnr family transcriptional regulator n=1 Tax=Oryzomicrobium sp. TaxID=1911578 RepID=UPI0025ECAE44|nr:cyclic nucleotide-binding domain-containing protein [Oryzomicrobium sp.]MCE1241830.1 cyclic nucleotide-binding domain-containing protein [Oryzomicrobium sp.]
METRSAAHAASLSPFVLRRVSLFSRLTDEELSRIARNSQRRSVTRGTAVVRSGDPTDSLYILLTGSAKVTNTDDEGREVILSLLAPGDFFGEMGLIDGSPRSADVVALEACELLQISPAEFQRCIVDHFDVALSLMRGLVQRLRVADRKIESLALLDVYGRVARLLIDFSEEEDGRRIITRKLSKQDIAKMIGASREMVSRVMKDLETTGYIRCEPGRIILNAA